MVAVIGTLLGLVGLVVVLLAQSAMGASWRIGVDETERTERTSRAGVAAPRMRRTPPPAWRATRPTIWWPTWNSFARTSEDGRDHDGDSDLVKAYARLLANPDAEVRERAAREWCAWEERHVAATTALRADLRYADPAFRMRFARLVTHY